MSNPGLDFEKIVQNKLNIKPTLNSGAMNDDADLKDEFNLFECKLRSTKSTISVSETIIKKLIKQANKWCKSWCIIYKSCDREYAILPFKEFAEYYNFYKEHNGQEKNN